MYTLTLFSLYDARTRVDLYVPNETNYRCRIHPAMLSREYVLFFFRSYFESGNLRAVARRRTSHPFCFLKKPTQNFSTRLVDGHISNLGRPKTTKEATLPTLKRYTKSFGYTNNQYRQPRDPAKPATGSWWLWVLYETFSGGLDLSLSSNLGSFGAGLLVLNRSVASYCAPLFFFCFGVGS